MKPICCECSRPRELYRVTVRHLNGTIDGACKQCWFQWYLREDAGSYFNQESTLDRATVDRINRVGR